MTAIQAESLPVILEGQDLIAQAKTGSGKTAAFGLGLLANLNPRWFAVQGLVLCPTRELADQVAQEIRRLARGIDNIKVITLCGGTPMGPQVGSLEHGAHIVVGTPGRLQDHLFRQTLDLSNVKTLVLDEADRMIDMGFIEEIARHRARLPEKPPDPAVLCHLSGQHPQGQCAVPAPSGRSKSRSVAQRRTHRTMVLQG
ncbi:DEAD/DEAH box helicase [Paludibacterium denitrificans]|uniref:DEAD/DEAH box helicase n=1 Tax=Paludibacterium denitrificans TaxID=2675226 RepID=UPI001E467935|nr:DEAD/DEAH box helicase [Paludibacterium denitrificans]